MYKEPIKTMQDILADSVGPMANFVIKEQMKLANVDPIDPSQESLYRMIDLIEERCLNKLLDRSEAKYITSKLKGIVNRYFDERNSI